MIRSWNVKIKFMSNFYTYTTIPLFTTTTSIRKVLCTTSLYMQILLLFVTIFISWWVNTLSTSDYSYLMSIDLFLLENLFSDHIFYFILSILEYFFFWQLCSLLNLNKKSNVCCYNLHALIFSLEVYYILSLLSWVCPLVDKLALPFI